MVQTHGSVQLSLGAASIYGVIDTDSKFSLRLTPGADGAPRAPIQTSLRGFFCMMEVNNKSMDMPSERIKRKLHRIFFEHGGANQHPGQEFCGMPRSTDILVA